MAVTSQPQPTGFQIGDTCYYVEGNIPVKGEIKDSITVVTDTDNNSTAEVVTTYQLVGKGVQEYASARLYASGSALKTAFDALVDALDA